MNNITMSFVYYDALEDFVQLAVLASVLSLVCTAFTEIIKNMLCEHLAKKNTSRIIAINGAVCIAVGVLWGMSFAPENMSLTYSIWLGFILWLGSQGLFTTLEKSNGFLGKHFRSLGNIVNLKNSDAEDIDRDGDYSMDKIQQQIEDLVLRLDELAEKDYTSDLQKEEIVTEEDELFRYPVNYIAVSEPFSSSHYAVDFGWNRNHGGPTPDIHSAFHGKADMAGFYTGGAGNMVRIYFDDENNNCRWYAIYKHLSAISVSKGDDISTGDIIGRMGSTGDSTGNHLHFDLVKVPYGAGYTQTQASRARYSVDPLLYLYAYPGQTVGDETDEKYNIKRFVNS